MQAADRKLNLIILQTQRDTKWLQAYRKSNLLKHAERFSYLHSEPGSRGVGAPEPRFIKQRQKNKNCSESRSSKVTARWDESADN